MNVMNSKFYKNVADYMPRPLPKPTPRKPVDEEGKEIEVVSVICEGIEW